MPGKRGKIDVYKRRLEVKKLYLQGLTLYDIAQKLGVSVSTIKKDIQEINRWYLEAVEKNPHILERQAEHILRHLDELKMVKERLWKLADKANSPRDEVNVLRAILDELSHEARVLRLIDVTKTINQYIHVDKIGVLVNGAIEVIKEFVPPERQKYALERLKMIGQKIIDSEVNKDEKQQ